jgi:hypothetical protein
MTESTPVACTLTAPGLTVQVERWERLMARALASRAQTADGVRLGFRAEPAAEDELRALAAVETECCAWATWTVERAAGEIVLDVRSTADGVAALYAMFAAR